MTNNVPDFESLRRAREAAGWPVPGLVYTSDVTFPRTKAYVSRLAAALAAAAADRETAALRRRAVAAPAQLTLPLSTNYLSL